jgi:hypothetical protein
VPFDGAEIPRVTRKNGQADKSQQSAAITAIDDPKTTRSTQRNASNATAKGAKSAKNPANSTATSKRAGKPQSTATARFVTPPLVNNCTFQFKLITSVLTCVVPPPPGYEISSSDEAESQLSETETPQRRRVAFSEEPLQPEISNVEPEVDDNRIQKIALSVAVILNGTALSGRQPSEIEVGDVQYEEFLAELNKCIAKKAKVSNGEFRRATVRIYWDIVAPTKLNQKNPYQNFFTLTDESEYTQGIQRQVMLAMKQI